MTAPSPPEGETDLLVRVAWHDAACPESFRCSDRARHSERMLAAKGTVIGQFLARLEELRRDPELAQTLPCGHLGHGHFGHTSGLRRYGLKTGAQGVLRNQQWEICEEQADDH